MGIFDDIKDTIDDVKDEAEEKTGIDIDRDGNIGDTAPDSSTDSNTGSTGSDSDSQSGDAGVDVDVSDEVQVDTDEGSSTFDVGDADGGSDGLVEVDPSDPTPTDARSDGVEVVETTSSSSGSSSSSGPAGVDVSVSDQTKIESDDPAQVQKIRENIPESQKEDTTVELNNPDPQKVKEFQAGQVKDINQNIEKIRNAPKDAKFRTGTGETVTRDEALTQATQQKSQVQNSIKAIDRNFGRNPNDSEITDFQTLFDPTKGNPDQTLDEELLTGGVDLMQEGEEFAEDVVDFGQGVKQDIDRAVIEANPFTTFNPNAQQRLRQGETPEDVLEDFSKGAATGGTQLAGLGIAATGGTARSLRSDTPGLLESAAAGPGLVKEEVTEDPSQFIAEEAGEEVGEKIVFGGLTGGAGLAASTVPIPEFTPETTPENNLQIEVGQGVDSNRLDSVFAEVDSEGNIQNPQRIENTGQVKGLIGDQETRFQSDQPFLTAEARNQETGELEGTFVGRVSSTGRSSDGQAEGLAESQALRIDEEGQLGNLGDSERKLFDFNVETEDSRSEQLFEIQGRDTIIGEQTTADISGEVGGERFIGGVESTVERNPRLGRRFRSNTLTAQENRRAGIETEGALIREDALENSDLIITDEGLGSTDSSSTELFDEPEDVQGLEDVLGIDSNQDTTPSEEPSFDSSTGNNQDLELLQETEQGQADNSIEGLAEAEQQAFTETVNDLVETQEPSVDTRNTNTVIGLEDSLQGQRQGPSLEEENVLGLEEFQRQESPPRQEIEENIIPEFEQETSPEPAFEGFEASISQETGIEFAPDTRSEPSLEFPGGDSKQEEEDITALFSGSGKDFRFDSSLGAELTGVTAEERPNAFATQDPFNLRPVLENNSNRRSENVENMF